MVNIGKKQITKRSAQAQATINLTPEIVRLITENKMKKGNVLTLSEIAGIMGAKRTSDLIPLCHNISLSQVIVRASLIDSKNQIVIDAIVQCEGKTGVEMEALVAVTTSALTVYDMCKKLSKELIISNIHLIEKSGGAGGDYRKKLELKFDHSRLDYGNEIHVYPQPL